MNITEFLEARITEDEREAGSGWERLGETRWERDNYGRNHLTPTAVLAECAAKRAIIARREDALDTYAGTLVIEDAIRALAAIYKDHPDYREEWTA